MARITFNRQIEYLEKMQTLEQIFALDEIFEKAIYAGAKIVADEIRNNLEALPEEDFRKLREGEIFHGIPKGQKQDLLDGFGIAPIRRDKHGFLRTKAGFDGYGSYPTNEYPWGVPNQLLAGAVESGSSVREKMPFVRPAVNATRKEAIAAMEEVVDDQIKEIF